jgi:gluconolactonase
MPFLYLPLLLSPRDTGGATISRGAMGKTLGWFGRIRWALSALALSSTVAAQAETLKDICGECRFEKFAGCGKFIEGINFDRNGHAWVVSLFSGEILEAWQGQCAVRAKTGGHANGARFHKDGRLFIADNTKGIITYDPATGAIATFADKIGYESMVNANDLVFDATGGLYATVPGTSNFIDRTGRVVYFPAGSTTAMVVADRLPYPNGITLTPDGKYIDIGLYGDKTIITLPSVTNTDTKRGPFVHARTEGGIGPDGMAMDSDGRLYWANFFSGAVGVTDPRGFVLGYMRLPAEAGRWTTNVAFHDGWLYLTEAEKGEIWRVKVTTRGQKLYYQP